MPCVKNNTHLKQGRNHEESRQSVCACCGIKKGNKCSLVSSSVEKLIQDYCNSGYSVSCATMAKGICCYCKCILYNCKKIQTMTDDAKKKNLPPPVNLPPSLLTPKVRKCWDSVPWNMIRPHRCRDDEACQCRLCSTARIKGNQHTSTTLTSCSNPTGNTYMGGYLLNRQWEFLKLVPKWRNSWVMRHCKIQYTVKLAV